MKKYRTYIVVFLVLAALVAAKLIFFSPDKPKAGTRAKSSNAPVNVMVHIVQLETLDNSIYLSGSIKGNENVTLQPEVQGKVVSIHFNEGQRVAQGQLLLRLNDEELQAQLKKTRAQIKIAAEKEQRLKQLLALNAVSMEEYDATLNQLQSLQADEESLLARLKETQIRAPFSGTIGLRNISVGSIVGPGTNIATLVQLDPVKLDFSVPEKYLALVHKGDKITFTIEGKSKIFQGSVYAIDPVLDESTRSVKLRAICPNPGGELSPGAFAKIELKPGQKQSALLIPTQALLPELKGQKVFVVQGGKAEPRMVTTGVRTSKMIEIISGLEAGDSVVTSGLIQLKPGSTVKLISSETP